MTMGTKFTTLQMEVYGEVLALDLIVSCYRENGATALLLQVSEDGSHFATLSINLIPQSNRLKPGEFYLKHWGETELLARQLIEGGYLELVEGYPPQRSGFVNNIRVYQLKGDNFLFPTTSVDEWTRLYTHSISADAAGTYIKGYASEVQPGQMAGYNWCYVRLLGMPHAGEYGHVPAGSLRLLEGLPLSEAMIRELEQHISLGFG